MFRASPADMPTTPQSAAGCPGSAIPPGGDGALAGRENRENGLKLDLISGGAVPLCEDLESIQDALPSPLLVLGPGSIIQRMNRACVELLGLSPLDSGAAFSALCPRFGAAHLAAGLSRLESGEPFEARVRARQRTFLAQGRPRPGGGGLVLFQDVSVLVRANRRLRRAGQRRRSAARRASERQGIQMRAALLNTGGVVIASWPRAGERGADADDSPGPGVNYLDLCTRREDPATGAWAAGIQDVLSGALPEFVQEFRDSSPSGGRWFRRVAAPVDLGAGRGCAIVHLGVAGEPAAAHGDGQENGEQVHGPVSVWTASPEGLITWVSESFQRISGYAAPEVLGRRPRFFAAPEGALWFRQLLETCARGSGAWTGEANCQTRRGELVRVRQTVAPLRGESGGILGFVVVHQAAGCGAPASRDARLGGRDELTGAWNREGFHALLGTAIARADGLERGLAVLVAGLDRFKDINSTLGHQVGDRILAALGRRLRGSFPGRVARLAGDEFAVLVAPIPDAANAAAVTGDVLRTFHEPLEIDGRRVFLSASAGVSVYPQDGGTAEVLVRNAGLAMEDAKLDGRRACRFFDRRLETAMRERVSIERDLGLSLGNQNRGSGQLRVAFQPQVCLQTGEMIGAECLLRWTKAQEIQVPIGKVVRIAEECGLIVPIGQWVIREAVARLAAWQTSGFRIPVSLNLSAVQFHHQDVFSLITGAARENGVAASQVKAEITESVLLNRTPHVRQALDTLHRAGIGLVLDDFGTGYSSLAYLQQFPFEAIKIDASFLRGIGSNINDEAIVGGIIRLAHSLGLRVIAEGVETAAQLDFLRDAGCDAAQGFLFSRPLSPACFEDLLAAGRRGGATDGPDRKPQFALWD